MRIGLISDTHSYLCEKVYYHFKEVDEIWHAGDVGDVDVWDKLAAFKPSIGVYGNIDDQTIRSILPEYQFIIRNTARILIIHIAGAPEKYNTRVNQLIKEFAPQYLICGHSHILKIVNDKVKKVLYINPGAAGVHGFHHIRTLLRFTISENGQLADMQAIELGKRGSIS